MSVFSARVIQVPVLVGLLLAGLPGLASVSIFVGRDLTADGSVLLAGFGDEPSSHWLRIEPARDHPEDATVQVGATADADIPGELSLIPQVPRTHGYIATEYSYFAGFPEPLTNGGLNDQGLAVRDVALFSRDELIAMTPTPQQGPHYSDLARLALERAGSAREAVDVVVDLIETHGFTTYGGNSHIFADPQEGWVLLEMAGGEGLWVARRLQPDEIWMNWRGYHPMGYVQMLPANWREHPDYLASDNFVEFAVEQGWHESVDAPLDVIGTYARPEQYSAHTAEEARRIKAELRERAGVIRPQDLMTALRSAGTDSAGYGHVAHLEADVPGPLRTLWAAPATPWAAAFTPWQTAVTSVPAEFMRHRYLTAGEAERQLIRDEHRGLESTRYAHHVAKRLFYLSTEHDNQFSGEVHQALDLLEARLLEAHEQEREIARVLHSEASPGLLEHFLTTRAHEHAQRSLRLKLALAESIDQRAQLEHGVRLPEHEVAAD